jgi:dihydropteroate synthase
MGVLNVTPDSFSDGGRYLDVDAAVARGRELVGEGADVVDVGGESTRPGAVPVDEANERARVVPVIEALAEEGVRISVDTRKASVAEAAVAAGASIINDVSASLHEVAARTGAAWVAMHMQGTPETMQADPAYDDVVRDVRDYLVSRAEAAADAGVREVWIDPGIGFGKTFEHNLTLLAALDELVGTGWPVLVGTSRKSFVGRLHAMAEHADQPAPVDDRLEGSLATAAWAAMRGAAGVRVHDVRATVHVLAVVG